MSEGSLFFEASSEGAEAPYSPPGTPPTSPPRAQPSSLLSPPSAPRKLTPAQHAPRHTAQAAVTLLGAACLSPFA
jgi:hypothetical protein